MPLWLFASILCFVAFHRLHAMFTITADDSYTLILRLSRTFGISFVCVAIAAACLAKIQWPLSVLLLLSYVAYAAYGWRAMIRQEWHDVKRHLTRTKKS